MQRLYSICNGNQSTSVKYRTFLRLQLSNYETFITFSSSYLGVSVRLRLHPQMTDARARVAVLLSVLQGPLSLFGCPRVPSSRSTNCNLLPRATTKTPWEVVEAAVVIGWWILIWPLNWRQEGHTHRDPGSYFPSTIELSSNDVYPCFDYSRIHLKKLSAFLLSYSPLFSC